VLDGSDQRDSVAALAAALRLRRAAAGWSAQIDRPDQRLSDVQIAGCRRMAAGLATEIAGQLGVQLDLGDPRIATFAGGLRRSPDLTLALMARHAEHAASAAAPEVDPPVEAPDSATAALLDALVVAEARRRDRFGGPLLPLAELPEDVRRWAAWDVAARLCEAGEAEATDPAIARGVHGLLLAATAEVTAPALAARLAAMFDERGLLDDRTGLAALASGQGALFAAMLGRRAGVPAATVWQAATAGGADLLALAARAGWSDAGSSALAEIVAAAGLFGGAGPKRPAASTPPVDPDLQSALARVMNEPRS